MERIIREISDDDKAYLENLHKSSSSISIDSVPNPHTHIDLIKERYKLLQFIQPHSLLDVLRWRNKVWKQTYKSGFVWSVSNQDIQNYINSLNNSQEQLEDNPEIPNPENIYNQSESGNLLKRFLDKEIAFPTRGLMEKIGKETKNLGRLLSNASPQPASQFGFLTDKRAYDLKPQLRRESAPAFVISNEKKNNRKVSFNSKASSKISDLMDERDTEPKYLSPTPIATMPKSKNTKNSLELKRKSRLKGEANSSAPANEFLLSIQNSVPPRLQIPFESTLEEINYQAPQNKNNLNQLLNKTNPNKFPKSERFSTALLESETQFIYRIRLMIKSLEKTQSEINLTHKQLQNFAKIGNSLCTDTTQYITKTSDSMPIIEIKKIDQTILDNLRSSIESLEEHYVILHSEFLRLDLKHSQRVSPSLFEEIGFSILEVLLSVAGWAVWFIYMVFILPFRYSIGYNRR